MPLGGASQQQQQAGKQVWLDAATKGTHKPNNQPTNKQSNNNSGRAWSNRHGHTTSAQLAVQQPPHHTQQTTTKCISNHCIQPFNHHHNPCQCHHTSKANTPRWSHHNNQQQPHHTAHWPHLVEGPQCGQHVWVTWHNNTHMHMMGMVAHTSGRPWMG